MSSSGPLCPLSLTPLWFEDLDHIALRPQKRGGLLGTGTEGGGGSERVKARLAIAQRLVHRAIAVSIAVLGQSHKDNVRCTAVLGQSHKDNVRCPAVEEQPEAKEAPPPCS